jgi:hypothetical protein
MRSNAENAVGLEEACGASAAKNGAAPAND